MARRKGTSTSDFGVGKRESHDATAFYGRFEAPKIERAVDFVPDPSFESALFCGDSSDMSQVPDSSVALVVTSPPYFAGKQYEVEFEREGVPESYVEYLDMLRRVFAECVRVLEPGGRIAVNVANLGRKPYRSLSADVISILQDDLGLLLRGEIIWRKSEGSNGNCAWGSFQSAANPVLRDITERVVVASKGQLDRAMDVKHRKAAGLPHRNTVLADDFMGATLDVWSIPPESARRVEHPAPFPVELPQQLIELFTFENDLVLDPFLGSGSSVIAAVRTGRRFAGFDLDPAYVDIAQRRLDAELERHDPAVSDPTAGDDRTAPKLARHVLDAAGFSGVKENQRLKGTGVTVSFTATDGLGQPWLFELAGSNTRHRGGLHRADVVWKALGRAAAMKGFRTSDPSREVPLVLLSSHLPKRSTENDRALRAVGPEVLFDVVSMLDPDAVDRLTGYAAHGSAGGPLPGFWTERDLAVD